MKRTRCVRAGHDLTLPGSVYIQTRPCGRRSRICQACKDASRSAAKMRTADKTVCKRGHDITLPDSYYAEIIGTREKRTCKQCRRESNQRSYERKMLARNGVAVAGIDDVAAKLAQRVAMESAPPWVRHPEPWDNVVYRRSGVRQ